MENNIKELKTLFEKIKKFEFHNSLRKGSTGIGYTFENLIGKKEDSNFLPDFKGIEIKTKLGYSKSPMTLFTLVPKKENDNSIKYILDNFGYPDKDNTFKSFRGNVYSKKNNLIANRFIFKIKINHDEQKLQLIILNSNLELIDNSIHWNMKDVETRLFAKLNYLAIIKGYPYKRNNNNCFKYTELAIYKLKKFDVFLNLIKDDKVFIVFNIGVHKSAEKYGQICDRGTAFRIQLNNIEELFDRID